MPAVAKIKHPFPEFFLKQLVIDRVYRVRRAHKGDVHRQWVLIHAVIHPARVVEAVVFQTAVGKFLIHRDQEYGSSRQQQENQYVQTEPKHQN